MRSSFAICVRLAVTTRASRVAISGGDVFLPMNVHCDEESFPPNKCYEWKALFSPWCANKLQFAVSNHTTTIAKPHAAFSEAPSALQEANVALGAECAKQGKYSGRQRGTARRNQWQSNDPSPMNSRKRLSTSVSYCRDKHRHCHECNCRRRQCHQ